MLSLRPRLSVSPARQQGGSLLEALVSILIFSLGLLGIIGMQATALSVAADSKYRTEASALASELIGTVWGDVANIANYDSSSGTPAAAYTTWAGKVATTLPGAQVTVAVCQNLAPAPGMPCDSTITLNNANRVTINLSWQANATADPHSYATLAFINTGQGL